MNRKYDVIPDTEKPNALAIIDNDTQEIVERGIVPENGQTAWKIAKDLRDNMNRAEEADRASTVRARAVS